VLIYVDSVILIYLLDAVGPFHLRARGRITALESAGDLTAVSDLSRLECRVKPLGTGDAATLARFDAYFARTGIRVLPLPSTVFERATLLRAAFNFKLADSLHLAAAILAGCDRFLTNDARLSRCTDVPVEVLPP